MKASLLTIAILASSLLTFRAIADTPADSVGSARLTGSQLKSEDLILTADAIWVGKIIKMGSESSYGPNLTMQGNQAQIIEFLRCDSQSPIEVDIPVDLGKGEAKPEAGVPYIFFVTKNNTRPAAWAMDPYDAIKLLKATDTNIAEVKRLVNLPANYHQLPGSQLKLVDVVPKSNFVFVGTGGEAIQAGMISAFRFSYFGHPVKISRVFRGSMVSPLSIEFHTEMIPHEDPPNAGQSYIFFVEAADLCRFEAAKIIPATKENIAIVEKLIPPPTRSEVNGPSICDDLDAQDALVDSDAIFVGDVVDPGADDQSDSYSFAFVSPHLSGVKIKAADVFRGTVGATTSATLFVNHGPNRSNPLFSNPYIFYAKAGNPGDKDPFTILKALPATDANLQMVKSSINPPADSVLSGSSLTPEEAVRKSDVIFLAEVTQPVAPSNNQASFVKVFKVVRGLVAKGNVWVRQPVDTTKREMPAAEGGTYIFCLSKTNPYNTDDFNVVKAIPATPDNIALYDGLAIRVPGPKPPASIDGPVRIIIAPDANNDAQ